MKEGSQSEMVFQLMTVEDVANYLRVRPSTVYEWAKKGKLPASKVGRLWRFEWEEIETWVRKGGVKSLCGSPDIRMAEPLQSNEVVKRYKGLI